MNLTDVIAITSAKIANGTIVDVDINSAAAISGTKVSPFFGSQNIQTSGDLALVDDSSVNAILSTAANAGNAFIQLRRSRGTQAAQTVVQNNDAVGQIVYYGHDGSALAVAGEITTNVAGTPAAGKIPMSLTIITRSDANTYASRFFINGANGDVGINTNNPQSKFHVAGDVTVTSTTTATTVGAAGGASALPATPVGYLVVNINGTARKIPYYNV
jgi:hypothetical protein